MKKTRLVKLLKNMIITIFLLFAATIIGSFFNFRVVQHTNIVIVYILSVLLIARFTDGYIYGFIGTIRSILMFNWFFTEPYFTLKVNDPTYIITFVIMSITATITSALTTKVKKAADEAKEKEAESNALYQMTNHLTDADDIYAIAGISVKTVSDILGTNAAFICFDENGDPETSFIQQKLDGTQIRRELDQPLELKRRMEDLHLSYDINNEFYDFPVYGRNMILAVIRIPKDVAKDMTSTQIRMLHSIMESSALAMERFRSLQTQAKIREQATHERYRSDILRSISHDIRTPLSGIMGISEMLADMTDPEDPRYDLAKGIYKDADWLHSLVENILNLTKLNDGKMNLCKEPEAVEEVIGSVLMVIEKRYPEVKISISMPDELLMIPMDARLISQVLVNLLDNAVKHTPEEKDISVLVEKEDGVVKFVVSDNGFGISQSDLPYIFQSFYTTRGKSPDSHRGIGLGLAICQSIIEAHGGTIFAENKEEGGTKFTFTLPMGGEKL